MFVALVPPPEAIEDLDAFLEPRRESGPFRWALPEQFHVTLSFLAAVADRHLDELVERLERAGRRRTSFETRISGGGAFPNAGRARVVWAGLDLDEQGATELERLATGARAAASRTGIPVDGQRFRAHITVARLGRPAEVSNWVRLLDSLLRSVLDRGPDRARRVPPGRGARASSPLRDGGRDPARAVTSVTTRRARR